jgi:hypothetical protein
LWERTYFNWPYEIPEKRLHAKPILLLVPPCGIGLADKKISSSSGARMEKLF